MVNRFSQETSGQLVSSFPRLAFLAIMKHGVSNHEGVVTEDPARSELRPAVVRAVRPELRGTAGLTRREWLGRAAGLVCLGHFAALHGSGAMRTLLGQAATTLAAPTFKFSAAEDAFLEEMEKANLLFFWEQADPYTGLVKDRSQANGPDARVMASIASTGFGLTALCIGDQRGYLPHAKVRSRVRDCLQFLWKQMQCEHGFYYHWVNMHTGARVAEAEVSSIDTALLLCGVLTCRQHFDDAEIRTLATQIYERVDWPWMLNGGKTLSHGWKPESGFLKPRWDAYNELMMIYLLGLGSPTHPLPAETWEAWTRPQFEYRGIRFIGSNAPLFVHHFSQAWFDFRGQRDAHADFFENSARATRVHRMFCIDLHKRFPYLGEDLWGISASDSAHGYEAWGGPPPMGPLDGTLVPSAAGGSLPFLPHEAMETLLAMKQRFGKRAWKRYGFVDAFNPQTGWYDPDVIGIDLGITMLMAENARSQFVWKTFMKNEEMRRGMERAGFHSTAATGAAAADYPASGFRLRQGRWAEAPQRDQRREA